MNYQKTPIIESLIKHKDREKHSFHVPGHRNGSLFKVYNSDNLFENVMEIDQTELTGLDDLHSPSGCIEEAQLLLSKLYNSYKSYFLVGGSTIGNLAAIFSVCNYGDKVLVQRNCHKSIINAIRLKELRPVFIDPKYDYNFETSTYLDFESVKTALDTHIDVKALILTSPNYYGLSSNYENIITYTKKMGKVVICDEAHGAHYIIGKPFPKSVVQQGAHITIQSAHKTLPAMTMASWLHVSNDFNKIDELEYHLGALQSSSPSYPIMASLDYARLFLQNYNEELRRELEMSIKELLNDIYNIPQLCVCYSEDLNIEQDILKIKINSNTKLNGFELQKELEKNGIFTELADHNGVLLVHPLKLLENKKEFINDLYKSVKEFKVINRIKADNIYNNATSKITSLELNYQELSNYNTEYIDISDAENMICAQDIVPYPPGIPFIIKGERLTEPKLRLLKKYIHDNYYFQNAPFLKKGQIAVHKLRS
ncbi:MAG: arginine decarboxylase [Bacillales bacterium]|jgi:arginine/lysine/ornithine decarboxylase|nr:arginine decarboxylase [Bacillales bacterium]